MRTFIFMTFILYVLGAVAYWIMLMCAEYPRERTSNTIANDLLTSLINAALAIWAAYLLWG